MNIHLINLLLIALFFVAALGIDLLLEAVGGARFLTSRTITALCGGGIAGWLGIGMMQETLPFGSIVFGGSLLALAMAMWMAVAIRNFRVAAPATAAAGTALQFGIGYVAGPAVIIPSILLVAAITTQFFRLFSPVGGVVPVVNGKPTK